MDLTAFVFTTRFKSRFANYSENFRLNALTSLQLLKHDGCAHTINCVVLVSLYFKPKETILIYSVCELFSLYKVTKHLKVQNKTKSKDVVAFSDIIKIFWCLEHIRSVAFGQPASDIKTWFYCRWLWNEHASIGQLVTNRIQELYLNWYCPYIFDQVEFKLILIKNHVQNSFCWCGTSFIQRQTKFSLLVQNRITVISLLKVEKTYIYKYFLFESDNVGRILTSVIVSCWPGQFRLFFKVRITSVILYRLIGFIDQSSFEVFSLHVKRDFYYIYVSIAFTFELKYYTSFLWVTNIRYYILQFQLESDTPRSF